VEGQGYGEEMGGQACGVHLLCTPLKSLMASAGSEQEGYRVHVDGGKEYELWGTVGG
jgi:hypothetical protein